MKQPNTLPFGVMDSVNRAAYYGFCGAGGRHKLFQLDMRESDETGYIEN